jgi:hypothetical protein
LKKEDKSKENTALDFGMVSSTRELIEDGSWALVVGKLTENKVSKFGFY